MKLILLVAACLATSLRGSSAESPQDSASPKATPPAYARHLEKWRAARFGLFVHWGPVSLKGTEIGWSRGAEVPLEEYDRLYQRFNPTNFDARAWVKLAKDAGMKYLVFTTKHHDGFCMWDTQQTDFNIMRSPFGRDVVKELAAACQREHVAFGTYHSVCDWHHPDFLFTSPGGSVRRENANLDRYERYLRAQVAELITHYGPLEVMWFDVPQGFDVPRGQALINFTRSLQPDLIVNNRSGAPGDFDTPEQRVGKFQNQRPWETCMTMCQQWAWKPDDTMKSLQQCLRTLIACAGGDGNLLFNVGPMPDGRIEPRQVERLKAMGVWLRRYGRSIYGTRGGPYKPGAWGASTHQGRYVYLHVFNWSPDGLALPPLGKKIVSAKVLTGGKAAVEQRAEGLVVRLPRENQQDIATVIRLKLDGPAGDIKPMSLTAPNRFKATASNVHQEQEEYSADQAFDGDPETRWATNAGTRQAWLEVDLGQPTTFSRIVMDEWGGTRVQSFKLQYREAGEWKTFLEGTTVGPHWQQTFDPVRAQQVRLLILDATEGPTINEFEVHAK